MPAPKRRQRTRRSPRVIVATLLAALLGTGAVACDSTADPNAFPGRDAQATMANQFPTHTFTGTDDAARVASEASFVVCGPGKCTPDILAVMRYVNPHIQIAEYDSATAAMANEVIASCQARDAANNTLVNGFWGTFIEKPNCQEWINHVRDSCWQSVYVEGYDTCYLDLMTEHDVKYISRDSKTMAQAPPANYPIEQWQADKYSMLVQISNAIGRPLWVNCFNSGADWPNSLALTAGCNDTRYVSIAQAELGSEALDTPQEVAANWDRIASMLQQAGPRVLFDCKLETGDDVTEHLCEVLWLMYSNNDLIGIYHNQFHDPTIQLDPSLANIRGLGAPQGDAVVYGTLVRNFKCGYAVMNKSWFPYFGTVKADSGYLDLSGNGYFAGQPFMLGPMQAQAFRSTGGCTP